MFWEAQPSSEVKASFPDDVKHIFIDPLEGAKEKGTYNYVAQFEINLETFEKLGKELRTPVQEK